MTDADTVIPNGAMLVRRGMIIDVGARGRFLRKRDRERIDLGGMVLAPGLVNAHCHLEYTCCLGRIKRGSFLDWLPVMIQTMRELEDDKIREGVTDGLRMLLRGGVTNVGDVVTFNIAPAIIAASGIRHTIFSEAISMSPPPYDDLLSTVEQRLKGIRNSCSANIPAGSPASLTTIGLAPHAPYTVARPLMAALRHRFQQDEAQKSSPLTERGLPFSLHVAESQVEAACLKRQTGGLAEMFRDWGFYAKEKEDVPLSRSVMDFLQAGQENGRCSKRRDLLVHGNYLSNNTLRSLAAAGRAVLVLCPGTREYHGVGSPILDCARQDKMPIALGTDSLASNDKLDMWGEMRKTLTMSQGWKPRDAWRAATVGGALALGLEGQTGELRKGYQADFIAVGCEGDFLSDTKGFFSRKSPSAAEILATWLLNEEYHPSVKGSWVAGRRIFPY